MKHASHAMHENSIAAWHVLKMNDRRLAILKIYGESSTPLTDRQVAQALGFSDLNAVRPRITELIEANNLVEVGKMRDPITGVKVRTCTT